MKPHHHSVAKLAAIAGAVMFCMIASAYADRSLAEAVKEFNDGAVTNEVGAKEPPLTTAEITAAIRAWDREKNTVSDEIHAEFVRIAEEQTLPEGATLEFCTEWVTGNMSYQVWWVDVTVKTGETTGYTYRIRERMIDSRRHETLKVGGSLRLRGEWHHTAELGTKATKD